MVRVACSVYLFTCLLLTKSRTAPASPGGSEGEMRRKVVEGVAAALRGEFPRVVVNPEVRPHARLLRLRPAG